MDGYGNDDRPGMSGLPYREMGLDVDETPRPSISSRVRPWSGAIDDRRASQGHAEDLVIQFNQDGMYVRSRVGIAVSEFWTIADILEWRESAIRNRLAASEREAVV
tara:strand:- start:2597 stop:2914 length:318 start_codon:yes stop_codon:yes gene_type:complete